MADEQKDLSVNQVSYQRSHRLCFSMQALDLRICIITFCLQVLQDFFLLTQFSVPTVHLLHTHRVIMLRTIQGNSGPSLLLAVQLP